MTKAQPGPTRQYSRFDTMGEAEGTWLPGGHSVLTKLSLGGACLHQEGMVPVGHQGPLRFRVGAATFQARCRVVYTRILAMEPDAHGGVRRFIEAGIEFVEVSPTEREHLEAVVNAMGRAG